MARVRLKGLSSLRGSLRKYAKDVRVEVAREMTAVMEEVQDAARRMAPVDTGQLQGSIQPDPRTVDPEELTGSVGTNVEYAAVQEFGFTGSVSVSAHKRTMTDGFGPDSAYPMTVTVDAHTRRMDREGNFFLTKAAQAAKQTYSKRIANAIQRAQ
jgi:HK97 gp10 family phage protein